MKNLFKLDLKFNWKIVIATISSTLLIMIDHYHRFTGFKPLDRFILYLIVPLIIIVVVLRENPKEYGFQLGDWKAGLALTGIVILIAAPILWLTASGDPTMKKYYEWLLGPQLPGYVFLDLFGWEFIFRGLAVVWVCASLWSRCAVAAIGALCPGAHRQAGGGDAVDHFWRLLVWLGGLPHEVIPLSLPDPLFCFRLYRVGGGRGV